MERGAGRAEREGAPSVRVVSGQRRLLEVLRDPFSAAVSRALERYVSLRLEPEEEEAIERVERRRAELLASSRRVTREGEEGTESLAELCAEASKSEMAALLLFLLVRELRPLGCLELGTAVGISAAYQGSALKLNGFGRLVTIERQPEQAAIAAEGARALDLPIDFRVGLFRDVLPDVLDEIGVVDYAFIDGHHRRKPTLDYFDAIVKRARHPSVLVFDDVNWSDEMVMAWSEVKADGRGDVALDLGNIGVLIVPPLARA